MKLDYRIFDPTGNITLLVETPVPAAMQPRIAAQLMALEPRAEQVGFLSPDGALRMADEPDGVPFSVAAGVSGAAVGAGVAAGAADCPQAVSVKNMARARIRARCFFIMVLLYKGVIRLL